MLLYQANSGSLRAQVELGVIIYKFCDDMDRFDTIPFFD
jgi:hypothetical protein